MINRALRSFYRRRIAVPLDSNGLMLDVGCGDKPHWRADVLVDKYIGAEYASQRNVQGAIRVPAPVFEAALEDLPFRDSAFDFVYCSHVLEHVEDPGRAITEMARVGRSGYIEVPLVGLQKIRDHAAHLWHCRLANQTLIFEAKRRAVYDEDIDEFLRRGPLNAVAFVLNFFPDAATIQVYWSEEHPITYRVEGTVNVDLRPVPEVVDAGKPTINLWPAIRRALRLVFCRRLRHKSVSYNSIVKPEYAKEKDEVLVRAIYRIPRRSLRERVSGDEHSYTVPPEDGEHL